MGDAPEEIAPRTLESQFFVDEPEIQVIGAAIADLISCHFEKIGFKGNLCNQKLKARKVGFAHMLKAI